MVNPRVLIFDDDANILELCEIILSRKNMNVIGCNNCNSPVETVKEVQPDVILMDNWIQKMGGIKSTQLLKEDKETSGIPVIFFSANSRIEDLCVEAKADYYLQKPFEISQLEAVIHEAVSTSNRRRQNHELHFEPGQVKSIY
jgi:DNA-binding response OmpR family regulator